MVVMMADGPTVEQAEMILDALQEYGFGADLEIREDYSGRGMYGSTCVAFVGGETSDVFVGIGILVGRGELEDEAFSWFRRRDSMGFGEVIY